MKLWKAASGTDEGERQVVRVGTAFITSKTTSGSV
jgi:hypothetical protein